MRRGRRPSNFARPGIPALGPQDYAAPGIAGAGGCRVPEALPAVMLAISLTADALLAARHCHRRGKRCVSRPPTCPFLAGRASRACDVTLITPRRPGPRRTHSSALLCLSCHFVRACAPRTNTLSLVVSSLHARSSRTSLAPPRL